MGVLALKAYAKCRLKPEDGFVGMDLGGTLGPPKGDAVTIKHIPQVRKTPSWPRSWANFSLL
jgi:hypothetical protein